MDLWQQVQQVFDAALQHSPDKRQKFLEQEGGSNQELRREVESLLAAHEESDSFMAEPAIAGRPGLHFSLYRLAFLRGDVAGMQQQVAWATGKPGLEDRFLSMQSDTEV